MALPDMERHSCTKEISNGVLVTCNMILQMQWHGQSSKVLLSKIIFVYLVDLMVVMLVWLVRCCCS